MASKPKVPTPMTARNTSRTAEGAGQCIAAFDGRIVFMSMTCGQDV